MTKSSSAWHVPIPESATFHPVKYSIANLPKNIKGLSKKRSTVVIEPTCEYYCQVGYRVVILCVDLRALWGQDFLFCLLFVCACVYKIR